MGGVCVTAPQTLQLLTCIMTLWCSIRGRRSSARVVRSLDDPEMTSFRPTVPEQDLHSSMSLSDEASRSKPAFSDRELLWSSDVRYGRGWLQPLVQTNLFKRCFGPAGMTSAQRERCRRAVMEKLLSVIQVIVTKVRFLSTTRLV